MFKEVLYQKVNEHNKVMLNRYIRFIECCLKTNKKELKTEKHHICPKAKDLFPEYESFKAHPWNLANLTPRQHYIAHWMLFKIFGGSQIDAFWRFNNKQSSNKTQYKKIGGRTYENLKQEKSKRQRLLMISLHKTEDFSSKSRKAAIENNEKKKNFRRTI